MPQQLKTLKNSVFTGNNSTLKVQYTSLYSNLLLFFVLFSSFLFFLFAGLPRVHKIP